MGRLGQDTVVTGWRRFWPVYWIVLATVAWVAVVYAERRHFRERYQDHLRQEADIRRSQDERERLEDHVEATRRRVGSLDSDPLEIEAGLRRNSGLVRVGERVYRMKEVPRGTLDAGPAGPGPGAPSASKGGTGT